MGMSTYLVGFKPPDEKWKRMLAIWNACAEAKIEPPEEVGNYFGWEPPDSAGVSVENLRGEEYRGDGEEGIEVDLRKLDPDVKILRFVNNW